MRFRRSLTPTLLFTATILMSLPTMAKAPAPAAGTRLGIKGTAFTLNDRPTFLLGASYYGALAASDDTIRQDLDDLERRGFNWIRVWATWGTFGNEVSAVDVEGKAPYRAQTRVEIADARWRLNGKVTYPGAKAEGLLLNVRMVNAVFEDAKRKDFDPEANTAEFLAVVPDYVAHGVRAFTLCLQGGFPGYEGAVNSAFAPDGSLRPGYLARVSRVIEACDQQGAVVILGCYYQRQDQVLRDEAAVRAGVVHVARWIRSRGYTNVLLEIANEYPHRGFDHRVLRTPEGEAGLIELARRTAPGLLVSTSGIGDGRHDDPVAHAADFLLAILCIVACRVAASAPLGELCEGLPKQCPTAPQPGKQLDRQTTTRRASWNWGCSLQGSRGLSEQLRQIDLVDCVFPAADGADRLVDPLAQAPRRAVHR